jgi:hypothetical protein
MFLSRRSCMCCLTSVYWLGGIRRYGWAIGLSSVKLILCWTVVGDTEIEFFRTDENEETLVLKHEVIGNQATESKTTPDISHLNCTKREKQMIKELFDKHQDVFTVREFLHFHQFWKIQFLCLYCKHSQPPWWFLFLSSVLTTNLLIWY